MTDTQKSGDDAAHPESLQATVALRLGRSASFDASARSTPAGLVSIGVMVGSILLGVAVVIAAARWPVGKR